MTLLKKIVASLTLSGRGIIGMQEHDPFQPSFLKKEKKKKKNLQVTYTCPIEKKINMISYPYLHLHLHLDLHKGLLQYSIILPCYDG